MEIPEFNHGKGCRIHGWDANAGRGNRETRETREKNADANNAKYLRYGEGEPRNTRKNADAKKYEDGMRNSAGYDFPLKVVRGWRLSFPLLYFAVLNEIKATKKGGLRWRSRHLCW